MTPRLSVRNLSVRYAAPSGNGMALDGVSFDLGEGERLAIIGESGSGKSTLALAIAGLLPPTAQVSGTIEWTGLDGLPGRDIGFVFQDPGASLDPVMRVGRQIAEVVHTHTSVGWADAHAKAVELIDRVRMPEPARIATAFPHQLSGGQKQRIAIAAAVCARPKLLIADEPTSALDTIVQGEIVALIDRLVKEERMSLIFISHDIALASAIADRIAVFRAGRMVEVGTTDDITARPREPYTRALIEASTFPPALMSAASS